ncbi:hypothetical protein C8R43DRAFT_250844 [Mycena crocata]|nr:hypothetical protein C8R43DRAFT_250844 [Mycena crocata]
MRVIPPYRLVVTCATASRLGTAQKWTITAYTANTTCYILPFPLPLVGWLVRSRAYADTYGYEYGPEADGRRLRYVDDTNKAFCRRRSFHSTLGHQRAGFLFEGCICLRPGVTSIPDAPICSDPCFPFFSAPEFPAARSSRMFRYNVFVLVRRRSNLFLKSLIISLLFLVLTRTFSRGFILSISAFHFILRLISLADKRQTLAGPYLPLSTAYTNTQMQE